MSICRQKSAKSVTLKIWRRGDSYHCCGRSTATGTRPVKSSSRRQRQWPQLEKLTMACLPTRSISRRTMAGSLRNGSVWLRITQSKLPSG